MIHLNPKHYLDLNKEALESEKSMNIDIIYNHRNTQNIHKLPPFPYKKMSAIKKESKPNLKLILFLHFVNSMCKLNTNIKHMNQALKDTGPACMHSIRVNLSRMCFDKM